MIHGIDVTDVDCREGSISVCVCDSINPGKIELTDYSVSYQLLYIYTKRYTSYYILPTLLYTFVRILNNYYYLI